MRPTLLLNICKLDLLLLLHAAILPLLKINFLQLTMIFRNLKLILLLLLHLHSALCTRITRSKGYLKNEKLSQ
jgi:hypothetical protein